jgi:hypothetical protein
MYWKCQWKRKDYDFNQGFGRISLHNDFLGNQKFVQLHLAVFDTLLLENHMQQNKHVHDENEFPWPAFIIKMNKKLLIK